MPSCYIAGPMRGLPEYNYPAFHTAAKALRELGWTVFSPAEMDIEKDKEDYAARTIEEQKLHDTASAARRFATRDLAVLTQSLKAERGDAIILLPGWWKSTGARAEHAAAVWVGLRVLTIADAIQIGVV